MYYLCIYTVYSCIITMGISGVYIVIFVRLERTAVNLAESKREVLTDGIQL